MNGYLTVRRGLGYQKLYFVLEASTGMLSYYQDYTGGQLGAFSVMGGSVALVEIDGKGTRFTLTSAQGKCLHLRAETAAQALDWVGAISAVQTGGPAYVPTAPYVPYEASSPPYGHLRDDSPATPRSSPLLSSSVPGGTVAPLLPT
eukprot:RCo037603